MDKLLKKQPESFGLWSGVPTPRRELKKPIVFRSIGVMQSVLYGS
ncbi:MAG: hypothetical protein ACQEQO_12150 [Thermodesulfobacteriota bacterium]